MRIREIEADQTHLAFTAMRELRTHLGAVDAFAARVDGQQRAEGYRLVGAFEDAADAVAVAGFRVAHNLAWGRHLYVDDVSTVASARRRGHARALLAWLLDEARRRRCDELHLDSGVGPDRVDAHRLYFATGLRISSHHFSRSVPAD